MRTLLLACVLTLATMAQAQASVIINVTEVAADVVVDWSGTIDTSAASFLTTTSAFQLDGISPNGGFVGHNAGGNIDVYDTSASWVPYGTGGSRTFDSASGSGFALFTAPQIALPAGYSGGLLGGTGTFNSETFLSLGLTPGSYTTTFSNGSFSDSVTVNIGGSAVPEPSTIALTALALLSLGAGGRRRRTK